MNAINVENPSATELSPLLLIGESTLVETLQM